MKRLAKKVAVIGSTIVLIGYLSNVLLTDRYNWNYRLTVTLQTPDGPVTRSTVKNVRAFFRDYTVMGNEVSDDVYGEALVLPLSDTSAVFVLHRGSGVYWVAQALDGVPSGNKEMLRKLGQMSWSVWFPWLQQDFDISPDKLPRMALLRDTSDPTSFERLSFETIQEILGNDYSVSSAEISFTTDPVSLSRAIRGNLSGDISKSC
ncbi:MAG: hypothetical protein AAFV59_17575 [Pseudomonadota bacterium]